jgi:hypothetical protein
MRQSTHLIYTVNIPPLGDINSISSNQISSILRVEIWPFELLLG